MLVIVILVSISIYGISIQIIPFEIMDGRFRVRVVVHGPSKEALLRLHQQSQTNFALESLLVGREKTLGAEADFSIDAYRITTVTSGHDDLVLSHYGP